MKNLTKYLLAMVVLCCGFAAASHAAPVATGSLKEMVYELPADSGKFYLTLAGSTQDRHYTELRGLFGTNPEWIETRNAYHYTPLSKQSKMYQARYANEYKDYPTVRLQTADGSIVREWSGRTIPAQDDLLAELKAECFRRRRVQPQPHVQPDVQPDVQPNVQPIDSGPEPINLAMWRAGAVAFVIGLALAMRSEWLLGMQDK